MSLFIEKYGCLAACMALKPYNNPQCIKGIVLEMPLHKNAAVRAQAYGIDGPTLISLFEFDCNDYKTFDEATK